MRWRPGIAWVGGVLCVLGIVLYGRGYSAPTAGAGKSQSQEVPTAGQEIVVDVADLSVAQANRLLIEKRLAEAADGDGVVQLPPGVIHLDQHLLIGPEHSGVTLQGAGMGRTVLRNSHNAGTHNRTLLVQGTGINYATAATQVEGATVTLPEKNAFGEPEDLQNYAVGRVVWGFQWNAFYKQQPPPSQRYVVRGVDAARRTITFDRPANPELMTLKWCDGSPIADVAAGALEVRLEGAADATTLPPGRWVFVSDGPAVAHEARGEYRRVVSTEAQSGVVTLDRPLLRGYRGAALVRIDPVEGVTVRDLTLGQPVNRAADPFFAKFGVDLRLERVRVGVPGEPAAAPAFCGCGYVTLRDCEFAAPLGLNTCHDVAIRGGRLAGVAMEEACTDVALDDVRIAAPGGVHGVHAYLGSERIAIRGCRIEGFGRNEGGGHGSPLAISAPDCLIRDVTTFGTDPVTGNYLAGDGLRIEGLVTDVSVHITQGRGVTIRDSRAAKHWELRAGTSGRMENCLTAGAPSFAGQQPPAGWRIDGRAAGERGRGGR